MAASCKNDHNMSVEILGHDVAVPAPSDDKSPALDHSRSRQVIEQLLKLEPAEVLKGASESEHESLLERLECYKSLLLRCSKSQQNVQVAGKLLGNMSWEIILNAMSFLDGASLVKTMFASRCWQVYGQCESLWQKLAVMRWPPVALLCDAQLQGGSLRCLYLRRAQLELIKVMMLTCSTGGK